MAGRIGSTIVVTNKHDRYREDEQQRERSDDVAAQHARRRVKFRIQRDTDAGQRKLVEKKRPIVGGWRQIEHEA
jgi:hypothetical protein